MPAPRGDRQLSHIQSLPPVSLTPVGTDLFGGLVDQLSERIAERVVVRINQMLDTRSAPPDAYRIDQAAKALGLSQREIRRRVASGELAHRKVGRAVLVPREALADFLTHNGSQ